MDSALDQFDIDVRVATDIAIPEESANSVAKFLHDVPGTSRIQDTGETRRRAESRYEPLGAYLLRAPVYPISWATELLSSCVSDLSVSEGQPLPDDITLKDGVLAEYLLDPIARTALTIANPGLVPRIDHAIGSRTIKRRLAFTLIHYLTRMGARPTPFGLFSGVMAGRFGNSYAQRIASDSIRKVFLRADSAWAMSAAGKQDRKPEVSGDGRFIRNDLVYCASGRLWLSPADAYGNNDRRGISLRATSAVRLVLDIAANPATMPDMKNALARHSPEASEEQIDELLRNLVDVNVLIRSPRPRVTHLPRNSTRDGIDRGSQMAHDDRLDFLIKKINDNSFSGATINYIDDLQRRQLTYNSDYSGPTVQVDTELKGDGAIELPHEVGELAGKAADILMRISSRSAYPESLYRYMMAFADYYGANAEVPLTELISEETGLGAPEGYCNPPRSFPLPDEDEQGDPPRGNRTAILSHLAMRALASGGIAVRLTPLDIRMLEEDAGSTRDQRPFPPTLDIAMQVLPPSCPGRPWGAVLNQFSASLGGRFIGRFGDLLGENASGVLGKIAEEEAGRSTDVVHAEVAYMPISASSINVATRPLFYEWEISVNVSPAVPEDHVVRLDDIVVGIRNRRFYLRSRRLRTELVVHQGMMLETRAAPNPVRLMLEISRYGYRGISGFNWETLPCWLPFLPRLTYGEIVLSSATWSLRAAPEFWNFSRLDFHEFTVLLAKWRQQWRVPRWLYLAEEDNRLLLDIENPVCVEDLWHISRSRSEEPVLLSEVLPFVEDSTLHDENGAAFASEIIVPLRLSRDTYNEPAPGARESWTLEHESRAMWPDDGYIYYKLYGPEQLQDDLLVTGCEPMLKELLSMNVIKYGFFIRYWDPAPHVRLRLRLQSASDSSSVSDYLSSWIPRVRDLGFITDAQAHVYRPEIDRYGGPDALEHAELFFAADSLAAMTFLDDQADRVRSDDKFLRGAAMIELLSSAWLGDIEARRKFLRQLGGSAGGMEYRATSDGLWRIMTDMSSGHVAEPAALGLRTAARQWGEELTAYVNRIDSLSESGALRGTREYIVKSILHMHCNRIGIIGDEEKKVYGIARRLLDRLWAAGQPAWPGTKPA